MTDFAFTLEDEVADPPDPDPVVPTYSFGAPEFLQSLLQLLPPGAAWTRAVGSKLYSLLEGFAPEFARVQARAVDLLREFVPGTATEMLDEHEFVWGLPDPCAPAPTTTEERQAALASRLLDNAGHNPADYVAVAEALGHAGTTVHRRPYPPFRAGVARAGQRLYGNEWPHVFAVAYMTNTLGTGGWFTTGSGTSQTSTTRVAPDGTSTAREITFGVSGFAYKNVLTSPVQSAQLSVWLRVDSGTASVKLTANNAGPIPIIDETFVVDTVWRRYTLRSLNGTGTAVVSLEASSEVVEVWGEKVGVIDYVLECRFSKIAQVHTLPEFWAIGEYAQPFE